MGMAQTAQIGLGHRRRAVPASKTAALSGSTTFTAALLGRSGGSTFVLLLCLVLCTLTTSRPAYSDIVIENVRVLPFIGESQATAVDVYIVGDRIAHIGPDAAGGQWASAKRVDGTGKFLIPGLTEMHGHIPPVDKNPQFLEDVLFLYVARGVTTVRGMLGRPGQLHLKRRVAANDVIGPTLYLASPGFGGNKWQPAQAAGKVRQYADQGWDLVKIFPGLSLETFNAIAEQAAASGIPFAGHVPLAVGLGPALASGMRTIDHLDGYIESLGGESRALPDSVLRAAARRTKAAGVGVVPTMAVWETLLSVSPLEDLNSYAELSYLPPEFVKRWRDRQQRSTMARLKDFAKTVLGRRDAEVIVKNRHRLLKIMAEEGVEILFGTDAPQRYSVPGFSVMREIRTMIRAGLSNRAILESATLVNGRYFAAEDRFGVVAPGARADLVLLDANPLEDLETLAAPAGVVLRGRWLSADEIATGLAAIAARHRQ